MEETLNTHKNLKLETKLEDHSLMADDYSYLAKELREFLHSNYSMEGTEIEVKITNVKDGNE